MKLISVIATLLPLNVFFPRLIAFPLFCPTGPVDLNMMSKCAPCLANPCQNNGTCVSDVTGSYHCTCPFGYKVKDCFVLTHTHTHTTNTCAIHSYPVVHPHLEVIIHCLFELCISLKECTNPSLYHQSS